MAYTPTAVGSPTYSGGYFNAQNAGLYPSDQALTLSGTGQYINFPEPGPYDQAAGAGAVLVFEMFVTSTATGRTQGLVNSSTGGFSFYINNTNKLAFFSSPTGGINSTATIADGAWHHVVCLINGATVWIYADGTRVGTHGSYTAPGTGSALQVAADGGGASPLAGRIDELRMATAVGVYTGTTYTVPTAPYANSGTNQVVLCHFDGALTDTNAATPLAAGSVSVVSYLDTVASLSAVAASGGTSPYTYQWYRSTSTGFTPGVGSLISGAVSTTLNDSGLTASTTYYYKLVVTDASADTATSTQTAVTTTPPTLTIGNQDQALRYGGAWSFGGLGVPFAATGSSYAVPSATESEVRLAFTGTKLEMQTQTNSGATVSISIDGAAASTTGIGVGGDTWTTLASGLSDAAHTAYVNIPGSGGQNGCALHPSSAFRCTGAAPAFAQASGYAGAVYLLDGSQDAGIVPDANYARGGVVQHYSPNTTTPTFVGATLRFRARCAALRLFCKADTVATFGLTIDGVDQGVGTSVATPPVGPGYQPASPAWQWRTAASGLDDSALHDYELRLTSLYTQVWLYQLLAVSAAGASGGLDLAHPPSAPAQRLLGFGDSITDASQATMDTRVGFLHVCARRLGLDPLNRALSGTTAHQFASGGVEHTTHSGEARVSADVAAVSPAPEIILELYGTNDASSYAAGDADSAALYQASMVAIYTAIIAAHPQARIIALGLLDRNDDAPTVAALPSFRTAKQAAIASVLATTPAANITYLDLTGVIAPATDTVDNLHPNVAGHQKIASALRGLLSGRTRALGSVTV